MLLKRKEAAQILGVHEKTIYFWIKNGYMNAIRYGRNYKIDSAEVEYIKANGLRNYKYGEINNG